MFGLILLNFLKDIFDFFSQSLQAVLQLYVKLIENLTSLKIGNFVYLIRWDGEHALERWKLVLPDGSPVPIDQSMHQIGMTRDYIVLMDTAFTTGLEQVLNNPLPENKKVEALLRELLERPTSPDSLVYIVRRADLKAGQFPGCERQEVEVVVQKVVLPLEAAHFLEVFSFVGWVDGGNPTFFFLPLALHYLFPFITLIFWVSLSFNPTYDI